MVVKLIQIVNRNGRKGYVAETSPAAALLKRPPSARAAEQDTAQTPVPDPALVETPVVEQPAKNASHDAWVAYATTHDLDNRLDLTEAEQMSRDELVAHFNTVQED